MKPSNANAMMLMDEDEWAPARFRSPLEGPVQAPDIH